MKIMFYPDSRVIFVDNRNDYTADVSNTSDYDYTADVSNTSDSDQRPVVTGSFIFYSIT